MFRILIQMCNKMQIHTLNINQIKVLIQDMFDDTVPDNSFHRSSVYESNNDEIEMEIAIQFHNQNTQGSDNSFIPRRSVRVRSTPKWMKNDQYVFSQIHQPDWKSRAEYLQSLMSTAAFKDVESRVLSDALINIITKSSDSF